MSLLHRSKSRSDQPPVAEESRPQREITARVHTAGCSELRTATVRGFRLASGDGADVAGFDLGPSPEEHLLVALGASLAQTIAHVTCARDLSVDRLDIELTATLIADNEQAHIAGRLGTITAEATIASEDGEAAFEDVAQAILTASPMLGLLTIPLDLHIAITEIEPGKNRVGDWQI